MAIKRIALVTGGVGGIGSAICIELMQKGMKVIAGYHPNEAEAANATDAMPARMSLRLIMLHPLKVGCCWSQYWKRKHEVQAAAALPSAGIAAAPGVASGATPMTSSASRS